MPSTSQVKPSAGTRILLVDDDVEIIESMEATFTMKGYQVLIARDGNQGLAMAEQHNPALAILDMMMPKRSGFLVLEKLREFELKRAGFRWSAPSDFYVLLKLLSHIQESGSRRKDWWSSLAVGSPECVADRTAVAAAPELMRVIMITANEGERHRRYAKEHLAVDVYLRKPKFSMEQLLDTVETLLADEPGKP